MLNQISVAQDFGENSSGGVINRHGSQKLSTSCHED